MGVRQRAGELPWPTIQVRWPDQTLTRASVSRQAYAAALLLVVTLGVGVRLLFVLGSDFPLNDGGLFYQMARDVQHSHYALPASTTYNGAQLPFAYPPLGIYAAALLNDVTGMSMLEIFRYLPLVVSSLTIGAFFLLARDVLESRLATTAATLIFALVPRGFEWMIMGGGVTRSFGLLFALLTIRSSYRLYVRRERHSAVTAAIFGSLTVLSHPELAWFAVFSCGLLLVGYGRTAVSVRRSLGVAAGVTIMVTPWLAALVAMHGIAPFAAALRTGDHAPISSFIFLIELRFTDELLFPLALVLGLLGTVYALARGHYLLPAWLIVIVFLDPRGMNNDLVIPLALLGGIAVRHVLYPMVSRRTDGGPAPNEGDSRARQLLAAAVFTAGALYLLVGAVVSTPVALSGLSSDQRAAMAWAAAHTSRSSTFLIVTGAQWPLDSVSEWFPVLAERQSVATVQGYEWASADTFGARVSAYDALQKCVRADARCIGQWLAQNAEHANLIYVSKDPARDLRTTVGGSCCVSLLASLRASPGYSVAFDGPGATIFRHD